jgi:hypothetical protein
MPVPAARSIIRERWEPCTPTAFRSSVTASEGYEGLYLSYEVALANPATAFSLRGLGWFEVMALVFQRVSVVVVVNGWLDACASVMAEVGVQCDVILWDRGDGFDWFGWLDVVAEHRILASAWPARAATSIYLPLAVQAGPGCDFDVDIPVMASPVLLWASGALLLASQMGTDPPRSIEPPEGCTLWGPAPTCSALASLLLAEGRPKPVRTHGGSDQKSRHRSPCLHSGLDILQ